MTPSRSLYRAILFAGISLHLGCAALAPKLTHYTVGTTEVPRTEVVLSPSHATIMVLGMRGFDCWLVNGDGQVLGQSQFKTHTVLAVPAGPITLYAMPGGLAQKNGERIDGEVRAGHLYYVTIGYRFPTGFAVRKLTPESRDNRWQSLSTHLGSPRVVFSESALPFFEEQVRPELGESFRRIDERRASHNKANIEERTIRPDDGWPDFRHRDRG
jgi:hypothetical protein